MSEAPRAFLIADRALETMEREARRWPDRETGGTLVGYRQAGTITVTHTTGPGPNAVRTPVTFSKDTPYLQRALDYLFHCFRVNYLGVWHQHPPDMPDPSQGDLHSAWQDVTDPEVPGDDLLIPVCTQRAGAIQVIPYLAQRGGYSRVEWQTVPFTGLLNGQWYECPQGRQRAAQEMEALRSAGARVDVIRTEDGTYNLRATLPQTAGSGRGHAQLLVFGCPQDYPVTAPEVALYDASTGEFFPASMAGLASWGLDSTLASLYREVASPT